MSGSDQASPLSLSVFFPAYNDAGTIASLVISALQTASKLTPNYEIIVVNDGSSDSTAQILDELARVYPQLKIVTHPVNRGYGGALRSGFATASKDIIFYTDGDAQYDPSEMELLWPKMVAGRRSRQRLQDQPLRSVASHRHRADLSSHREDACSGCRCATSTAISA